MEAKIENLQHQKGKGSCQEKKLKELNRGLEFQRDELLEQLETSDEARRAAKRDLKDATEKITELE